MLYRLFDEGRALVAQRSVPAVSVADYLTRACSGGYPEAATLDRPARRRWFRSYLRTIIARDLPEIARGRQLGELPTLLRTLAARTGQELVIENLARETGIERRMLSHSYLPLLETVYLTVSVPAWSRNFTSRAVKHPKGYIADPGLAAHLLGVDEQALASPTSALRGPLIETFVVDELIRQASRLLDPEVTLHHYRTRDKAEVDVIAEAPDGRIVAFEVKAARSASRAAFRTLAGLRDLVDRAGGRFVAGIVLYLGDDALPAGDRLALLPLSHLWRPR